jgi:GNAT superfamily N-acetyltransferase
MSMPSFERGWSESGWKRPRIYVLEVRDRHEIDKPPIAWLVIEREERYRRDPCNNEILDASIRISYERLGPRGSVPADSKGDFSGGYTRGFEQQRVSLTSPSVTDGAVFLDLPELYGQRIGSYLMNEVVNWVRQWPQAEVAPVKLIEGQARGASKERRNRFYEKFGLVFDYRDADHREGLSRPMPAASLQPIESWKENLRELEMRGYINEVLTNSERESLELKTLRQAFKELWRGVQAAERHPAVWAIKQMWARWSMTLAGLVVVGLFLGALWREIARMM